jgi:hypothetical protein
MKSTGKKVKFPVELTGEADDRDANEPILTPLNSRKTKSSLNLSQPPAVLRFDSEETLFVPPLVTTPPQTVVLPTTTTTTPTDSTMQVDSGTSEERLELKPSPSVEDKKMDEVMDEQTKTPEQPEQPHHEEVMQAEEEKVDKEAQEVRTPELHTSDHEMAPEFGGPEPEAEELAPAAEGMHTPPQFESMQTDESASTSSATQSSFLRRQNQAEQRRPDDDEQEQQLQQPSDENLVQELFTPRKSVRLQEKRQLASATKVVSPTVAVTAHFPPTPNRRLRLETGTPSKHRMSSRKKSGSGSNKGNNKEDT